MSQYSPLLLVEDDQIDALTIKRALADLGLDECLVHVNNGVDALDYLRRMLPEVPRLILLDLNMPKMNGHEFLKELKSDLDLRRIPVVVLTTSKEQADISSTFRSGVAGYMVKPLDYFDFVRVVQAITQYWHLSTVPAKT
ncbi:MAG: response regulator [Sedimentisphaerales bacterium]|nr:response regulator [Sedimentisphaerales bacterium]